MTTNPYIPPQTLPSGSAADGEFPEIPLGWGVCFGILVILMTIDLGVVIYRFPGAIVTKSFSFSGMLGLIALGQAAMVFSIRWILFRMILRRRRPGDLQGVVPLVGVAVIFTMVKLIEYQGFRLWSESETLGKLVIFLVPSLLLMLFMSPRRLMRFQAKRSS